MGHELVTQNLRDPTVMEQSTMTKIIAAGYLSPHQHKFRKKHTTIGNSEGIRGSVDRLRTNQLIAPRGTSGHFCRP